MGSGSGFRRFGAGAALVGRVTSDRSCYWGRVFVRYPAPCRSLGRGALLFRPGFAPAWFFGYSGPVLGGVLVGCWLGLAAPHALFSRRLGFVGLLLRCVGVSHVRAVGPCRWWCRLEFRVVGAVAGRHCARGCDCLLSRLRASAVSVAACVVALPVPGLVHAVAGSLGCAFLASLGFWRGVL